MVSIENDEPMWSSTLRIDDLSRKGHFHIDSVSPRSPTYPTLWRQGASGGLPPMFLSTESGVFQESVFYGNSSLKDARRHRCSILSYSLFKAKPPQAHSSLASTISHEKDAVAPNQ